MTGSPVFTPPADACACFNCTAWADYGDIGVADERGGRLYHVGRKPTGQCRAAPPTRDPEEIGHTNAAWPVVTATDWCRAFEARPASRRAA